MTERADFLAAAKAAKAGAASLHVQLRGRADAGPERVGLTVTRKVGTATERNRIRRRLRAALGEVPPAEEARDIVVVARREVLSRRFPDLVSDLDGAIRRAATKPGSSGRPTGRPGASEAR
jgi:ribonuclease P protein component